MPIYPYHLLWHLTLYYKLNTVDCSGIWICICCGIHNNFLASNITPALTLNIVTSSALVIACIWWPALCWPMKYRWTGYFPRLDASNNKLTTFLLRLLISSHSSCFQTCTIIAKFGLKFDMTMNECINNTRDFPELVCLQYVAQFGKMATSQFWKQIQIAYLLHTKRIFPFKYFWSYFRLLVFNITC